MQIIPRASAPRPPAGLSAELQVWLGDVVARSKSDSSTTGYIGSGVVDRYVDIAALTSFTVLANISVFAAQVSGALSLVCDGRASIKINKFLLDDSGVARLVFTNTSANTISLHLTYLELGLVTDFGYLSEDPASPEVVIFTDTTEGNPTDWLWDFGDGGISTSQNPVHLFPVGPATYSVQLTASNLAKSNFVVKDVIVVPAA